jgi:MFS family permease
MARESLPLGRNRDFLLLWVGEVISTLGSQMSLVAFPLLVLATTHSAVKAGLVGFANRVPVLAFYLPVGLLVDRRDRRMIMIISSVAEQDALPLVVAPGQVSAAIARNQARLETATLAGLPLGGVLFGVARVLPFAFDSVSYLASALGVFLVRTPLQEPRSAERRAAVADVREAIRWFWSHAFLRDSALVVGAGNFMWMALELVLIVRAREHGAPPAAVGVMIAGIGIGGLVGSLFAPAAARRLPSPVVVIGLFWIEATLLPLLALTHDPYLLGFIVGGLALGGPTWNAVVVAARLTLTPDPLRGRVNSVARLISGSMLALGAFAGGLLTASVGTTDALLALAAWQLIVALAATASSSLRTGLPTTRSQPPPRHLENVSAAPRPENVGVDDMLS